MNEKKEVQVIITINIDTEYFSESELKHDIQYQFSDITGYEPLDIEIEE